MAEFAAASEEAHARLPAIQQRLVLAVQNREAVAPSDLRMRTIAVGRESGLSNEKLFWLRAISFIKHMVASWRSHVVP
ncbi:MAG TPA: hypothetical protein VK446_03495 [Methylocystis sp.]|nr:hypothetical protein [Methylocystis sp.]